MQQLLIIKLRHHGDVLLTTPLFRAIKAQFPNCAVDTLIYRETTPLLEGNPDVRQVYTIDRTLKGWARFKAELKLLLAVRRKGYDAVVHLTDQWQGALITGFSKALVRVQMSSPKRDKPLWHRWFTHRVTPPPRGQAHAVELNLLCLKPLGVDPNTVQGELVLHPTAAAVQQASQLLVQYGVDQGFALIHPAARWPFKCWGDDQFAEIVAGICQQGIPVVLSSSPDPVEMAMTAEIERQAKSLLAQSKSNTSGQIVNLAGQLRLPVLAALLQQARFYVGVDSAPMHMAAALGTPQLALFGPSWLNEWRPWSRNAAVIYAGDFGPLPHPDSINTDDPTRLLQAIPVAVVQEHVARLIKQTASDRR